MLGGPRGAQYGPRLEAVTSPAFLTPFLIQLHPHPRKPPHIPSQSIVDSFSRTRTRSRATAVPTPSTRCSLDPSAFVPNRHHFQEGVSQRPRSKHRQQERAVVYAAWSLETWSLAFLHPPLAPSTHQDSSRKRTKRYSVLLSSRALVPLLLPVPLGCSYEQDVEPTLDAISRLH